MYICHRNHPGYKDEQTSQILIVVKDQGTKSAAFYLYHSPMDLSSPSVSPSYHDCFLLSTLSCVATAVFILPLY